jgi:CHAT domain-containing protein
MCIKNKSLIFVLILLGATSVQAIAQNAQERFDKLYGAGDELYDAYEYEKAAELFEQSFDIAIEADLPFSFVYDALYAVSLSYKNALKFDEAIESIQYTINTYSSELTDLQFGEQYYLLGSTYINSDQFEKAFGAYEQSIHFYQNIEMYERVAKAYAARGIAYIETDEYDLALADLQQAEALVPDENEADKSFIYMTFYSLYLYMETPTLGVAYLEKAYELAKKTGNKENQLNTATYLADHHVSENKYSEGLAFANEALFLAKETNDLLQLSTIYDIIGRIYYGLSEFEKSIFHFNEAIAILQQLGLERKVAEVQLFVGQVALSQGELDAAKTIFSGIKSQLLHVRYQIKLLHEQADLYMELEDFTKAENFLNQSMALISDDLEVLKPQIYFMYLKLPDDIISPEKKLEYAKYIYRLSGTKSLKSRMAAEFTLAKYFEPFNADSAFYYAYTALEKLENRRLSTYSSALKNSLNTKWQHVYYLLAHWEVEHKKDYSKAFELHEQAKSRALFDQIYEQRFLSFVDAENPSSIQLLELQKKIDRLYHLEDNPTLGSSNSTAIEIAELELQYQSLQDELVRANPAMQDLTYPTLTTLEEAQKLLDRRTALINYGVMHDQLFIFLVKDGGFRFIPILDKPNLRDDLTEYIEAFRDAIISKEENERLSIASKKLTQFLIEPISSELEDVEHLIIIPDGPLHLLPFEALMHKNRYLIEHFAIKYIPSVSVFNIIDERQPIDFERSLVGLASTGFESGDDLTVASSQAAFSTLPYTLAEIDSITTSFLEPMVLKNEQVTEAAFKALDLSEYRFMHFATHGNINESAPEQSGLILSKKTETETLFGEDGYLNAREISQLDINANLVVLSACNTGVGRIINGEGVMGLQRSFLAAGASSVMVSLWSIFDRSTPIFMNKFYKNLLEIEDEELSFIDKALMYANLYSSDIVDFKTLALQQTKKQMIEHPYYNHPVHWAPFVLTGK